MSKRNHLREAKEALERTRENLYKSRGGRPTQVHRNDAYSRKQKHKNSWS